MIMFFLKLQNWSRYWRAGSAGCCNSILLADDVKSFRQSLVYRPWKAGCSCLFCSSSWCAYQMAQRLRHCPMPVQNLVVTGKNLINTGLETDEEAEQNTGAKLLIVAGIRGMHVKMNKIEPGWCSAIDSFEIIENIRPLLLNLLLIAGIYMVLVVLVPNLGLSGRSCKRSDQVKRFNEDIFPVYITIVPKWGIVFFKPQPADPEMIKCCIFFSRLNSREICCNRRICKTMHDNPFAKTA